ncbi:SusC/RagA family TonB-linked outer membrane protein [Rufibacter ruber]|uniref:SusC/RagA family TonB-linked outer membrane protein n=1 Tax=Rufibacter ruber TaxID=1783499 RepID=UPI0009ED9031|nr:SusC/RagA family TonB-linked outer membrane protein [Rufibacter ruber]
MNWMYKVLASCLFCFLLISTCNAQSEPDATVTASGTVVDKNGKPLEGVAISVQENTREVTTGPDGKFSMECISNEVLIFKKNGYNIARGAASELENTTVTMVATLIEAGDEDNVQIPFGVRKRRAVSASVSSIKTSELPQLPLSTLTNVLAGRLPGLYIQQLGSRPGTDDASMLIRGRSSYNSNQSPLLLIDGVERDFVDMDLNEIESISVLKDAATLAWYGMTGANGVVYVTTKRGSSTSTRVTLDAQGGVQTPVNLTKPLDAYTYATLYNRARAENGEQPLYDQTALDAYQNGTDPYRYPNNNFVKQFIKKAAPVQRYVATVSGGNSFVQYFTLLSYYNQDGLYKWATNPRYDANTNFQRYNFRTNLNMHINKDLDIALDVNGRIEDLGYLSAGNGTFLNTLYNTPANAFPIYNEDATYGGTSQFRNNPLAMLNEDGYISDLTRSMMSTIDVKYKLGSILEGLSFNAFFTYDVEGLYKSGFEQAYEVFEYNGAGGYTQFGTRAPITYSASAFSASVRNNEFWGGFDYNRHLGQHSFNFSTRAQWALSASPGRLDNRRQGVSNRLSYGFKDRYYVDVVATFSQSQNFAPGKRSGWFPAVSAGWIVSDENFLSSAGFLDYLKIRGSVGLVGNDLISSRRFAFNNYWTRGGSQYAFGTSYSASPNSSELELANPNLTWEKARKASVGFDAKLFKQAVSLSVDYFYENRTDLMTADILPNVLGQSRVQVNAGEAQYKGIEAALNFSKNIGKLNVSFNGNFTYAQSEIIAINEEAGTLPYQSQMGYNIGGVRQGDSFTRRFLLSDGIFQSQEEIDAAPVQRFSGTVRPGDIKYRDVGGPNGVPDGIIDNFDFVMTDYSDVPKAYYGFGTTLQYAGFDVTAQFLGVHGRTIQINSLINSGSSASGYLNQFSPDSWSTATAQTALYPRMAMSDRGNNTQNSDYWLRSGDFLKLKQMELGYTLPAGITRFMRVNAMRFYVSGFNLLTFSKVDDLPIDPEMPMAGYGSEYPSLRTWAAGVSIKF